jgi:hypothetical protein
MTISSQLPPISLAQASANLRALAQAAGQTIEARILSQSSNGTAQVQIGRQTLNLALPEGQVVGSTLTLSVQQSDGQLRLAIVAVRPPATTSAPAPQPGVVPTPATSVHLSAAALASPTLAQALPPSAPAVPTANPASTVPVGQPTSGQPGPSVSGAPAVTGNGAAARPSAGYGLAPGPVSQAASASASAAPNLAPGPAVGATALGAAPSGGGVAAPSIRCRRPPSHRQVPQPPPAQAWWRPPPT